MWYSIMALNFKRIFYMAKLRTKPRCQWLIAVCTMVHIMIYNHCSALIGDHQDLLEKHYSLGFNPDLIQVNATSKLLSCEDISTIQQGDTIGRGTTKEVFEGTYKGRKVAIKMVTPKVRDVMACLKRRAYRSKSECYEYANFKLMKEIAYGLQINSDRLIKLLGYCVRGDAVTGSVRDQGVVEVVEFGKKLNKYRLTQFTWPERLQVAKDLADALVILEYSPIGSVDIGDFKLNQFILIDGRLKVGDLDDMSTQEKPCIKSRDCSILGETSGIECVNSTCNGINAKANILLATIEILEPLFENPPEQLSERVDLLLTKLKNYQINALELQKFLIDLTDEYAIS
ncbi:extracellular tyrosine-protein kinase PKDCC-like [Lytechinus variegatus]|uniref:extracellular tyrosine-protein kinase PKDCC-like n=1 Tax=Lytechinus variegatus TaxID=7654 RepID=UPI001BB17753|nr:extracellular tyrosine-protein kinase PKDCC-like [Lytechinus variegatus]